MQEKHLTINYHEYDSLEELPAEAYELMQCAKQAAHTAYAPYSHFGVGAAVRLEDGTLAPGSNQENAAYPSGLCAERVALFGASAQYPEQAVAALAVVGYDGNKYVEASPCGACRQVLAEYETRYEKPIEVYCLLDHGRVRRTVGVDSLLPFTFHLSEEPR